MKVDEEFETWQREWRGSDQAVNNASPSASYMRRRAVARRRRSSSLLAMAILFTLVLLLESHRPMLQTPHHLGQIGIVLALTAAWVTRFGLLRRKRAQLDAPLVAVKRSIQNAMREEKEVHFGRLLTGAALAALLASVARARGGGAFEPIHATWFPMASLIFLFALLFALVWGSASSQERLRRLRAVELELESGDEPESSQERR